MLNNVREAQESCETTRLWEMASRDRKKMKIRDQMQMVMLDMETVIKELRTVCGELGFLVNQVDMVAHRVEKRFGDILEKFEELQASNDSEPTYAEINHESLTAQKGSDQSSSDGASTSESDQTIIHKGSSATPDSDTSKQSVIYYQDNTSVYGLPPSRSYRSLEFKKKKKVSFLPRSKSQGRYKTLEQWCQEKSDKDDLSDTSDLYENELEKILENVSVASNERQSRKMKRALYESKYNEELNKWTTFAVVNINCNAEDASSCGDRFSPIPTVKRLDPRTTML